MRPLTSTARRPDRGGPARRTRSGRRWLAALVGCCGLALAVASLPTPQPASAAPSIPTAGQVAAAKQAAIAKAQQVSVIEAQLADASAALDRLQIAAQLAGQRYNAAIEKLAAAKKTAARAARVDRAAQAEVAQARLDVGVLVRSQVQGSTSLVGIASLASSDGPQELIDQLDTFGSISTVMQGKVEVLKTAQRKADAAKAKAVSAQAVVQKATTAAKHAKRQAQAAATAQQQAVDGFAGQRAELITELAAAQRTSVAVARQRQEGLEALARARAEAKRRAEARAQAAREARQRAREAAAAKAAKEKREREAARAAAERQRERDRAKREREARHHSGGSGGSGGSGDSGNSGNSGGSGGSGSSNTPDPTPVDTGGSGGYDAAGAQAAIAFAKAQLGEPYVFGATGPSTWDCSGLTMRAWEQSGHEIGHFTGTQWGNVQHISQSELRPGDLLFWGDGSNPSSIYHTALYLGGGMMIQAPRPGRGVEIVSMYYWIAPNLFGRV